MSTAKIAITVEEDTLGKLDLVIEGLNEIIVE